MLGKNNLQCTADYIFKTLNEASSWCSSLLLLASDLHEDKLSVLEKINTDARLIDSELGIHCLDWDSPEWQQYQAPTEIIFPLLVRFGTLTLQHDDSTLTIPALLPIIGRGKNVLITTRGSGKERARLVIQSIVLRLVATVPPNKLNLLCIDPVNLGGTVAGFTNGLPEITGHRAWHDDKQIENKLAELEQHIAYINQKLGISYNDIEEYNESEGQIKETYRLIVILDFPNSFTESSCQRLIRIANTGVKAGVYVILMNDEEKPIPRNFVLSDFQSTAKLLRCDDNKDCLLEPIFNLAQLTLDKPPIPKHFELLIKSINTAISESKNEKIQLLIPPQEKWWQDDSRNEISINIGQFEANEPQCLKFDNVYLRSGLIIGMSGSGKSTLLHTIITSFCFKYSPDEIELYLIDCKQVEFEDYSRFNLPHARVIGIQSGREFCLSILNKLDQELINREHTFSKAHEKVINRYRDKTKSKMPRILLIIDEFQELFSIDDSIFHKSEEILNRLIKKGRSFGINVLLASQNIGGKNTLPITLLNEITIRIALKLRDSNESSRVLGQDNNEASSLTGHRAIFNSENGLKEYNRKFQGYFFDEDERQDFLKNLHQFSNESGFYKTPRVFDGNHTALIENNQELASIINQTSWANSRSHTVKAWLGMPTEIKEHTATEFKRDHANNLLIIGAKQYEEKIISVLMSSLLSIATQKPPKLVRFIIFNVTSIDETWHDFPLKIKENIPHDFFIIPRNKFEENIKKIFNYLDNLIKNDTKSDYSLYVTILGLHYISSLRTQEKREFGRRNDDNDEPSTREMLLKILKNGSEKGIHSLIWCNKPSELKQLIDSNALESFDMRVMFQSSDDDSRAILDSPNIATNLGNDQAVLYNKQDNSPIEKFIPYELFSLDWLEQQGKKLKSKE